MSRAVTVRSPAKINLCLGVGPVRADGFHPLATVYEAVGLYDDVTLRPASAPDLEVVGEGVEVSAVPLDGTNLVHRAVELLAEHHRRPLSVAATIRKRIPVAGGLAGGSSDGAASLLAADALFDLDTSREDLLRLAGRLGSDVPFCLVGGVAAGTGRGELVRPVATSGERWWVLLPDEAGLSTPAVYAEFDRIAGPAVPPPQVGPGLLAALRDGDVAALGRSLANDLQPAALSFRPDLGDRLAAGLDASADGALVSGSGPTTVYLCRSPRQAARVAAALHAATGVTGLVVPGPVPGARLLPDGEAHR